MRDLELSKGASRVEDIVGSILSYRINIKHYITPFDKEHSLQKAMCSYEKQLYGVSNAN
jgi:hypothetical protein